MDDGDSCISIAAKLTVTEDTARKQVPTFFGQFQRIFSDDFMIQLKFSTLPGLEPGIP